MNTKENQAGRTAAESEGKKGSDSLGPREEHAIPRIDMSNYESRKQEIAQELWDAATGTGFFQLVNHGIPREQVDQAFAWSKEFFDLPAETKARYPLLQGTNAGWEYKSQTRPSSRTADQKESCQITLPRMAGLWPTGEELAGFKAAMLSFERANWALGMKVLECFATKLGFGSDLFSNSHDPTSPEYHCTLRLLHYMAIEEASRKIFPPGVPPAMRTLAACRCYINGLARVDYRCVPAKMGTC